MSTFNFHGDVHGTHFIIGDEGKINVSAEGEYAAEWQQFRALFEQLRGLAASAPEGINAQLPAEVHELEVELHEREPRLQILRRHLRSITGLATGAGSVLGVVEKMQNILDAFT